MPRTILISGASGSFKTSNIGLAARYLYKKTGKPTFLITTDMGGYEPIRDQVAAGYVVPLKVMACPIVQAKDGLLTLMSRLTIGWWPLHVKDGIIPAVKFDIKDWVSLRTLTPATSPCAAWAWEGLTSTGEALMDALINDGANVGQLPVGQLTIKDSDFGETYTFGKGSQSHYGYVQRHVMRWFTQVSMLPVEYVIVSSHEAKGEDDETKALIRGAGIVGKAATASIPTKIEDFIHFDTWSTDKVDPVTKIITSQTNTRAYFVKHPDMGIPGGKVYWDCKSRVPATKHAKLLDRFPGGYFTPTPTSGLDEYIRVTEELSAEADVDALRERAEFDAARQASATKQAGSTPAARGDERNATGSGIEGLTDPSSPNFDKQRASSTARITPPPAAPTNQPTKETK